jgi:hypothetical protein
MRRSTYGFCQGDRGAASQPQKLRRARDFGGAYVFTAHDELNYTLYIKKRKLWGGACDLNWPKYRDYRAAHADKCEPLNAEDLRYTGQWTSVFEK